MSSIYKNEARLDLQSQIIYENEIEVYEDVASTMAIYISHKTRPDSSVVGELG